jgi:hypothetical protein
MIHDIKGQMELGQVPARARALAVFPPHCVEESTTWDWLQGLKERFFAGMA